MVTSAALELKNVCAGYGQTTVLENVNLSVTPGESVSIIGRNGVGKSTLLSTVIGRADLQSGDVLLSGKSIASVKTHNRVKQGIGLVPQEREIFPSLTVEENLLVAMPEKAADLSGVYELFPQLESRLNNRGNQLSGGEQQMLAIGRALLTKPDVLLMDEPSEGLAPVVVETLQAALHKLKQQSAMTIVLVEQNSRLALGFSNRCIVMNRGQIVYDDDGLRLIKLR